MSRLSWSQGVLPREGPSGRGTSGAVTASTASWGHSGVCEPAELVLLNASVVAEHSAAASGRARDEGGWDQRQPALSIFWGISGGSFALMLFIAPEVSMCAPS